MLGNNYQKFINIMKNYCEGYHEETGGKNYRLHHQIRVAEAVYRIYSSGELKMVNEKIAVIGGLFHDIGRIAILKKNNSNILKFNPDDLLKQEIHEEVSRVVIKDLLGGEITKTEIDQICISLELPEDNSKISDEQKVIYDADALDELGALNLFRMFVYSGISNRDLHETARYWFDVDRNKKIAKVQTLFTAFAKKEAIRRIHLQDKVIKQLMNFGFQNKY